MGSPERKISGVASRGTSSVETRLAGLEEEAARLRAEVAALQDEIRWLTEEEDHEHRVLSDGWLARGWVRASMLMAVVGLVAFVSVPYVLHLFEASAHRPGLEVLEQALRNATPIIEVKPRRVGGATYQVPVEIRGDRRTSLGVRWLVQSARKRSGKSMSEKLAAEFVDAMNGLGAAVKRREDTHKMAEANRAFSHFKW